MQVAADLPEALDRRKVASARGGLPPAAVIDDAAAVFKVLANPARLRIMHALAHDELSVGDLARALGMSLSATSHQLALLRSMKLVAWRDEGRVTHYRAKDDFVGHLVHDCLAHVGERLGLAAHDHPHRADARRARPKRSARNR